MNARILHLSADYPDSIQPAKTRAISGLVAGTSDQFDHFVISLNRIGGLAGIFSQGQIVEKSCEEKVLAVRYAAPPAAVAIDLAMAALADRIVDELRNAGFAPDLVQGHKLTVEGLLARQLSIRLGVPYVLTLQGNTDQKLMTQRPDRKPLIGQVWRGAKAIMTFAPWTAQWCKAQLGPPGHAVSIIPCLLGHDAMLRPSASSQMIRTAFNLDFWRNKNIITLLRAVRHLANEFPDLRLEIAGTGSPDASAKVRKAIEHHGLGQRAMLVGAVDPEAIQTWFNGAALFALPSRRESFGMVFAEALLAGTPVVHPRGAAIDGFFSDRPFARSVRADNSQELASTIAQLLRGQREAKDALATAQASGELDLFQRRSVLDRYRAFLQQAAS